MSEDIRLVNCGCGGEARVLHQVERGYYVRCRDCFTRTDFKVTEAKAITAWNTAMGSAEKSSAVERTAKAKVNFKDENFFFGWCECGQYQSSLHPYCPACGAKLDWSGNEESD